VCRVAIRGEQDVWRRDSASRGIDVPKITATGAAGRRNGRDRRPGLEIESRRLEKLGPQPRNELIRMQAGGTSLQNRTDGAGDLERGQLRPILLDDLDLAREIWRLGF
jgi:hypothetical protein